MTYNCRMSNIAPPTTAELVDTINEYLHVDPQRARSLPLEAYRDRSLHELELEGVFRCDWLCVGREDQLERPGDWFTVDVVGEPVVITRDEDGTLRAFSALCRHRNMLIAEGSGHGRRLVCPYHRWSYDLTGTLRGTPLMDTGSTDTDGTCRLPTIAVDVWLGFVFLHLGAEPSSLADGLEGAAATLAPYDIASWKNLVPVDEIWPGNWKLALETALEGYHLDGLHAGAIAAMLPSKGSFFAEGHERWSCFRLTVDFDSDLGAPTRERAESMGGADAVASPTVSIHPHVNISFSPASTVWLSFLPIDVDRTHVIGGYLVPPDEYERITESPEELAFTNEVIEQLNREDSTATIALQRAAGSRLATRGPFNAREAGLIHFYRYLALRFGALSRQTDRG